MQAASELKVGRSEFEVFRVAQASLKDCPIGYKLAPSEMAQQRSGSGGGVEKPRGSDLAWAWRIAGRLVGQKFADDPYRGRVLPQRCTAILNVARGKLMIVVHGADMGAGQARAT